MPRTTTTASPARRRAYRGGPPPSGRPLTLARNFYHGTDADAAQKILRGGFSLERESWGRGWGNGVYLSGTAGFACTWGEVVLVCRLEPGTRILWHQSPNSAVLGYLRKEFGQEVLKAAFWKAVPAGKKLTRREAVTLWHQLVERKYSSPRRFRRGAFQRLTAAYPRIYEELRRHGYDGVAFRPDSDWPEMLVFNPTRVVARSVHTGRAGGVSLGPEIPEADLERLARRARRRNRAAAAARATDD